MPCLFVLLCAVGIVGIVLLTSGIAGGVLVLVLARTNMALTACVVVIVTIGAFITCHLLCLQAYGRCWISQRDISDRQRLMLALANRQPRGEDGTVIANTSTIADEPPDYPSCLAPLTSKAEMSGMGKPPSYFAVLQNGPGPMGSRPSSSRPPSSNRPAGPRIGSLRVAPVRQEVPICERCRRRNCREVCRQRRNNRNHQASPIRGAADVRPLSRRRNALVPGGAEVPRRMRTRSPGMIPALMGGGRVFNAMDPSLLDGLLNEGRGFTSCLYAGDVQRGRVTVLVDGAHDNIDLSVLDQASADAISTALRDENSNEIDVLLSSAGMRAVLREFPNCLWTSASGDRERSTADTASRQRDLRSAYLRPAPRPWRTQSWIY